MRQLPGVAMWAALTWFGVGSSATSFAQTAEDAARFVFENAALNQGTIAGFNADWQHLDVRLDGTCQIVLTRNAIFADTQIGPAGLLGREGQRTGNNPRRIEETAVIRLDQVLLQTGTVTTADNDGARISSFDFQAEVGAVRTWTVRLSERTEDGTRLMVPDGHNEYAWPNLRFVVVEQGEKAGRFRPAFEYLIGRYCAGKRSPY